MENNSLTHHGILGMKWGRRRYQNKDGSLTAAGKKRYGDDGPEDTVEQKMHNLRRAVDEMEILTAREAWPMPTYGDITFRV